MASSSPILYFTWFENEKCFHICSQRFITDSEFWENNNIKLVASEYSSPEFAFQVLSNILRQAGIILLKD
jgi:hypothetical protein